MWNVIVANEDQAVAISKKLPIDSLFTTFKADWCSFVEVHDDGDMFLTIPISLGVDMMVHGRVFKSKVEFIGIEYKKRWLNVRYDIHQEFPVIEDWLDFLVELMQGKYDAWLKGAAI